MTDEQVASEALYGPETRSGQVGRVEVPPTVHAVLAPLSMGGFRTVEMWTDWDAITWPFISPKFSVSVR